MKGYIALAAVAVVTVAFLSPHNAASGPHYLDAVEAQDRGDLEAALGILDVKAEQGNAEALNRLGEILLAGRVIPETVSPRVATYLMFTLAAKKGHHGAQTAVGTGLLHEGSADQRPRGIEWLLRAAREGYGPAQVTIGLAYRDGLGVSRDMKEARYWLFRAATQGDGVAAAVLGLMLEAGELQQDRALLRYLPMLPTTNLSYGRDDGSRPVSGTCERARLYEQRKIDDRLVNRFFDREDSVSMVAMKGSGVVSGSDLGWAMQWFQRNRPGRPAHDYKVLKRHVESTPMQMAEAETRAVFMSQMTKKFRPPMLMVDSRTFAEKIDSPIRPLGFKTVSNWDRMKLMTWPRAIQHRYREAAILGFPQAGVNLAIALGCAAEGFPRDIVRAFAHLHLADARGFRDARRIKVEFRKSMTDDQVSRAYELARELWRQAPKKS